MSGPSPKGLGVSAHTVPLYTVMLGKDSNFWYVGKTKISQRWMPLSIPSKFFTTLQYKTSNKIVIKKIKKGKNGNDILVYYEGPAFVYRDKMFEKLIKQITKYKFIFSEQGLQRPNIAHLEIMKDELIKLIKKI